MMTEASTKLNAVVTVANYDPHMSMSMDDTSG